MPDEAVKHGTRAVARAPHTGFLRLRFHPEIEAEYRISRRDTDRRWARMSLLVALSTVLGFAVIDHWVLPGPRIAHSDLVRFSLQLPMVLTMLVITDERLFDRWYQPAIQIAAPLFGLGTVLMATQASPEQLPLISARLVLAAFFFYFMLAMSLAAALRTNFVLMAGYAAVGVIGVVAPHVATYQLWTLFCANLIGAAGCYALERANRMAFLDRRRLADVAMHDGLTGLLNRAALEEQVRRLYRQASRDRLPVSVVLIDIDHFKAYNDRYGGEELIAVMIGADRSHAESTARAVLEAIRELRIPHMGSQTRPYVTASVGAATLEADADYSHDLAVQMADRALYAAKEGGRDNWSYFDAAGATLVVAEDPLFKTAS